MKKYLLSLIVLGALFFGTVHAQKFSVTFAPGYGMPLASQQYQFNMPMWEKNPVTRTTTTTTTITTWAWEGVKYSLGKGLQLNGAVGYALNDKMEVELGFSYLLGDKTTAVAIGDALYDPYGVVTYTTSSKSFSIMPGLVFKGGEGKIQPYMKLAAVLALPKVKEELLYINSMSSSIAQQSWEFKGGMAIGMAGAAGAAYSMSDKLSLFGELAVTSLSFSPKEASMTSAVYNGQDQMSGYLVRDKQVTFVDSYDYYVIVANQNIDQPSTRLKEQYPFSSVALKIGVKFKF